MKIERVTVLAFERQLDGRAFNPVFRWHERRAPLLLVETASGARGIGEAWSRYTDIVSVHESDTEYDGSARGHIRIAFGTGDPAKWELATLGEGAEAAAAEDVAIGDLNADGWLDLVVACELAHLQVDVVQRLE